MPWRDFLCKQILGQTNKIENVCWNIFIIDNSNDSNSHHCYVTRKKNMSVFRQQELPDYLNQMPNITQGHHHTQKNCLFLLQSCTPSFHTSVMMSITQFLSPVLQCEATIVNLLHTLSAPSFFLKPDASHVTKMKWCQGTLLSPSPSTRPCWCQKELTRIRITYTGDRNPNPPSWARAVQLVEHHSKKTSCAISSSIVWQRQRFAKEMIVMRVDLSSLSSSSSMVLTMSQKHFYSYGILLSNVGRDEDPKSTNSRSLSEETWDDRKEHRANIRC